MSIKILTFKGLNDEIEAKLKNQGFKRLYIKRHTCKYIYIINLLIKKTLRDEQKNNYGYVRLATSREQDLLGKARFSDKPNYPDWIVYRAVRHLEEFGIISSRRYSDNSNGQYKRYLECKIVESYLQKSSIETYPNQNIEPKFSKRLAKNIYVTPKKYKPIEMLYKKIKLNKNNAQKKLDEMIEKGYKLRARRDKMNRVVCPVMDIEKATNWQLKIDNFKHFWFKVDENQGRVYSNATNFPKDLRSCTFIEGHENEALWELDIRNSQPLILAIVAIQWFTQRGETVPKDLEEYKSLCEKGKFYNYFKNQLEKAGVKYEETLKTDLFMQVFFNKESKKYKYKFKKKFDLLFPSVGKCLSAMKNESNEKDGYKIVSKRLTKMESDIMIEGVSFKLIDKGVEFFPLHDAIYTLEKYTFLVQNIILEEFKKYGVKPSVQPKKVVPVKVA